MAEIIPAILSNDISDFRKKYAELFALSQHFKKMHIDFADGNFVRNKTLMPADLEFLKSSPLTLMAHLMTYEPKGHFLHAKQAGFKWVLFHYEAFDNYHDINVTINTARKLDLKVGLVLNPETPLHMAGKFITKVDLIQLMGIHPGFQGREFMPETFSRIKELRALSKNVIISVDGGVKIGIARKCKMAGADHLVAGSTILRAQDEEKAVEALEIDIQT